MTITLSVLILSLLAFIFRLKVFEATFVVFLLNPVIAFLFSSIMPLSASTYYLTTLILIALLLLYALPLDFKSPLKPRLPEFVPILVFLVMFQIFHSLCLRWPDFISIGERLRDFAILSSVIQSPVNLQEPWMSGFPLNYYAYWYRFGQMLSVLFGYTTWEVYHILQSFTYALFFTSCFRIFSAYLLINPILSFFYSLVICLGSNVAGIKDFYYSEPGWWGPSRVIPGAIDEFPSWSFLLGDLHPHYLNLPLIPFFICFFASVRSHLRNYFDAVVLGLAVFLTVPLWIYNSNVWEVPIWLVLVGMFVFLKLSILLQQYYVTRTFPKVSDNSALGAKTLLSFLIIIVASISLYLSKKNIITPKYPIDWVKAPIPRTNISDLANHFGIPLFLITAAFASKLSGKVLQITFVLLSFSALFYKEAIGYLVVLIIIDIIRIFTCYSIWGKEPPNLKEKELLLETLGLSAIFLLIVPEVVFLNDPYGAEIERMNTIFKVYSATWGIIHIFAFALIVPTLTWIFARFDNNLYKKWGIRAFAFILIAPLIFGFFLEVMSTERPIRLDSKVPLSYILPVEQGLSEINRLFPGAGNTIQELQKMKRGVTLEAQGNAYDYTTHVATLSENSSYLGWANHVNLLLQNDPEVGRRERVTEEFYNEKNCEAKKTILAREHIQYVVFGPLEKRRYKNASEIEFSCLNKLMHYEEYSIFTVG